MFDDDLAGMEDVYLEEGDENDGSGGGGGGDDDDVVDRGGSGPTGVSTRRTENSNGVDDDDDDDDDDDEEEDEDGDASSEAARYHDGGGVTARRTEVVAAVATCEQDGETTDAKGGDLSGGGGGGEDDDDDDDDESDDFTDAAEEDHHQNHHHQNQNQNDLERESRRGARVDGNNEACLSRNRLSSSDDGASGVGEAGSKNGSDTSGIGSGSGIGSAVVVDHPSSPSIRSFASGFSDGDTHGRDGESGREGGGGGGGGGGVVVVVGGISSAPDLQTTAKAATGAPFFQGSDSSAAVDDTAEIAFCQEEEEGQVKRNENGNVDLSSELRCARLALKKLTHLNANLEADRSALRIDLTEARRLLEQVESSLRSKNGKVRRLVRERDAAKSDLTDELGGGDGSMMSAIRKENGRLIRKMREVREERDALASELNVAKAKAASCSCGGRSKREGEEAATATATTEKLTVTAKTRIRLEAKKNARNRPATSLVMTKQSSARLGETSNTALDIWRSVRSIAATDLSEEAAATTMTASRPSSLSFPSRGYRTADEAKPLASSSGGGSGNRSGVGRRGRDDDPDGTAKRSMLSNVRARSHRSSSSVNRQGVGIGSGFGLAGAGAGSASASGGGGERGGIFQSMRLITMEHLQKEEIERRSPPPSPPPTMPSTASALSDSKTLWMTVPSRAKHSDNGGSGGGNDGHGKGVVARGAGRMGRNGIFESMRSLSVDLQTEEIVVAVAPKSHPSAASSSSSSSTSSLRSSAGTSGPHRPRTAASGFDKARRPQEVEQRMRPQGGKATTTETTRGEAGRVGAGQDGGGGGGIASEYAGAGAAGGIFQSMRNLSVDLMDEADATPVSAVTVRAASSYARSRSRSRRSRSASASPSPRMKLDQAAIKSRSVLGGGIGAGLGGGGGGGIFESVRSLVSLDMLSGEVEALQHAPSRSVRRNQSVRSYQGRPLETLSAAAAAAEPSGAVQLVRSVAASNVSGNNNNKNRGSDGISTGKVGNLPWRSPSSSPSSSASSSSRTLPVHLMESKRHLLCDPGTKKEPYMFASTRLLRPELVPKKTTGRVGVEVDFPPASASLSSSPSSTSARRRNRSRGEGVGSVGGGGGSSSASIHSVKGMWATTSTRLLSEMADEVGA